MYSLRENVHSTIYNYDDIYLSNVKISTVSNNLWVMMWRVMMGRSMTVVWLWSWCCGCSRRCSSGRCCRWGRWWRSHSCCWGRTCRWPLSVDTVSMLRNTTFSMDIWGRWSRQWRRCWVSCSTSTTYRRHSTANSSTTT